MTGGKAVRPEPGVHLTLTVDAKGVVVHEAGRIRHAPRGSLRDPFLTKHSAPGIRVPTSELALYVLARDGTVLDQFGWPYWMYEYYDRASEKEGIGLTGPTHRVAEGIRVWRFPLHREALFFFIVRASVVPSGEGRGLVLEHTPLALFWLCGTPPPPQPPPPPPLPVPGLQPPQLVPLLLRENPLAGIPHVPSAQTAGGTILGGPVPVVQSGSIDTCFNIVVVGDGFSGDEDMKAYDTMVRTLFCGPANPNEVGQFAPACGGSPSAAAQCPGLRHMSPFSKVWNLINVWSVRTKSVHSGITIPACGDPACAQTCSKQTYYRTQACFNEPSLGYVGTAAPERIIAAAALVVPPEYLHLVIVIVNLTCYGGRAVPAQQMVFTPMDATNITRWTRLVAHECGHVIGELAEERIVCVHKDALPCQPNQARLSEVNDMTVWWKRLARAKELDANGRFKAIDRCGEALDGQGSDPALYSMLGAFWGCQNISGTVDTPLNCNQLADSRGCGFFRPMSECRMRWLETDFCAVCDYEIATRIMSTCGLA